MKKNKASHGDAFTADYRQRMRDSGGSLTSGSSRPSAAPQASVHALQFEDEDTDAGEQDGELSGIDEDLTTDNQDLNDAIGRL